MEESQLSAFQSLKEKTNNPSVEVVEVVTDPRVSSMGWRILTNVDVQDPVAGMSCLLIYESVHEYII
jgi:hypothetical protein